MNEIELFSAALKLSTGERGKFLDQACKDNPELRGQVEALLKAHFDSATFLHESDDKPADRRLMETMAQTGPSEHPGTMIGGRYKLLEAIGEGGMGSVWLAEQKEPVRRKVAVKLIKAGMDSKSVLARFDAERQALAMMDHPNIAKVFDGGMTDQGRPYFVMEYVKGVPLTEYCDQARLSLKERLSLFMSVCQAVQHAHQKGIIHRDLKPSNILICLYDGKPVSKVIDFGLAKAMHQSLTEHSLHTAHGVMVGTPLYMSPEQAEHNNLDVDTRTDIYSLGVILYELLTGSTPLEKLQLKEAAFNEILRLIKEVEPPKPSTRLSSSLSLPSIAAQRSIDPNQLKRSLVGDLDWIVMKALDKERSRRYETANGLARDVERFLNDEAVEACPPSAAYRLKKLLRRNKGTVVAASLVLLALVAGTTAVLTVQARANANLRSVNKQLDTANTELVSSNTQLDLQRTRAEEREQQAIDAVNQFGEVVATEEVLKNSPQLEELRKALLKEPITFFQSLRVQLLADKDTTPESLTRLANASLNLGKLTAEIGNREDALIAFRESLAVWQRLVEDNPTVTEFQNQLATGYFNIGNVLSETGQRAEALEAWESALTIQKKLVDDNPTVIEFQCELANSHQNIGIVRSEIGQPTEALAALRSALSIQQKLADENPSVTEIQSGLASRHHGIGAVLRAVGSSDEALAAFRTALAIQQKLACDNPTVTEFQNNLAGFHTNIGNVLIETGEPAEALRSFESAMKIWQNLVRTEPARIEFQSSLAGCHINIGLVQSRTGLPAEALAAYQSALTIQKKLADDNPTVTEFQNNLAGGYLNIGIVLRITNQQAEAFEADLAARAICQRLVDDNPNVTEFQKNLSRSHFCLGVSLSDTGKLAEALTEYQSALTINKKLVVEHPNVTEFQIQLASSHSNIGRVLSETDRPVEAVPEFRSALTIWQKLAKDNPDATDFRSEQALCHDNIGLALGATGQSALALAAFQSARPIWQKLVHEHPDVTEFRNNLAANQVDIGRMLSTAAQPIDANRELPERRSSDPVLMALDARLAAVLKGEAPHDNSERLDLAQHAYNTQNFGAAAKFFADALQTDPTLADDRQTQVRYNTACCAALAGADSGDHNPLLDDDAKATLRKQALELLQAEMIAWSELIKTGPPEAKVFITQTLAHWQQDSDLSSLRDETELAKLPAEEQAAFKELWASVSELLNKSKS